jgi:secreted trypsin-like serine protease
MKTNVMLKFPILFVLPLFVCSQNLRKQPFFVQNHQVEISRDVRIVGGQNAVSNQFPHAAALFLTLRHGDSFCGGSIIHSVYILTAAHCLEDLIKIEVMAGTLRIFDGTPRYRSIVPASDTLKHPQYNPVTLLNDIGLIALRNPIIMERNVIGTIPLPLRNDRVGSGMTGTVIGWGRFSDGKLEFLFFYFKIFSCDCRTQFFATFDVLSKRRKKQLNVAVHAQ